MAYNTTHLDPETTFERHVYHRDQFAHFLRWTHVLRLMKRDLNVLDVCCGPGSLLEVIWRNRFAAKEYCGIDIRSELLAKNKEKFKRVTFPHRFIPIDIVHGTLPKPKDGEWDVITFFEGIEHISKQHTHTIMENIDAVMGPNTRLLISTPCFNGKAAENHIIDGEVCEYGYVELKLALKLHFDMHPLGFEHYGTFVSKADIIDLVRLKGWGDLYDSMEKYYDSNMMSVIWAPMFPAQARNVIWNVGKKKVF